MAEGGIFPWKLQQSDVRYANYQDLFVPLSPPPGKIWIKNETTKEWALVDSSVCSETNEVKELNDKKIDGLFAEHVVMSDDTLQGICLRYGTTVRVLKQYNNFPGENFRLCPTLLIPLENNKDKLRYQDLNDENIKMQLFQNKTALTKEEARYYLSTCDWDIDRAVQEYRLDVEYERNNQDKLLQTSSYDQIKKLNTADNEIIAVAQPIAIVEATDIEMSVQTSR